jgi:hypothetical protein
MSATQIPSRFLHEHFGELDISTTQKAIMDSANMVAPVPSGTVALMDEEAGEEADSSYLIEAVPPVPSETMRMPLEETQEYFGDCALPTDKATALIMANQVDCRYPRKVERIIDIDHSMLQLLGLDMGIEIEEFNPVDLVALERARLFIGMNLQIQAMNAVTEAYC